MSVSEGCYIVNLRLLHFLLNSGWQKVPCLIHLILTLNICKTVFVTLLRGVILKIKRLLIILFFQSVQPQQRSNNLSDQPSHLQLQGIKYFGVIADYTMN